MNRSVRAQARGKAIATALWAIPGLVLGAIIWEVVAAVIRSPFFPSLTTIGARFFSDWLSGPPNQLFLSDLFIDNALPTIARLAQGWVIGAVIGVAIGTAVVSLPRLGAALEPLIRLGMSIPAPALLPLAIALFGLGNGGKIFFIAFGALWPVITNTIIGLRNSDPMALASGRSLVLNPMSWFFRVRLPLASPQIMSGLRVSVNAAVLLIIVAELYAATSGIGFFIVGTQRNFDTVGTWSGIFLLALLGIACNALFVVIERRVMRWHIIPREVNS
jgi:ABC-type nitrate/sulfonate/bicarbonate transport system permease component